MRVDIVSKTFIITQAPVLENGEYILNFDIKIDLYSDAKEDWRSDPSLRLRSFPLTAVGGNPTVGSNSLGSTYFIASDWKIQLYATDHRFRINGNFYSEDGTSPFLLPVGNSVLLEQQVSNLVDSTVSQLSEIEGMSFGNVVTVDVISGQSGTTYPTGNQEYPVNNIPEAVIIASERGYTEIHVRGNLTLGAGDDVRGLHITGTTHINSQLIVEPDCLCLDTQFSAFDITGTLDGNSLIKDCIVRDMDYFNGHIQNSKLAGRLNLRGEAAANIDSCTMYGITTPVSISCGGFGQNLIMTNWSGVLSITDITGDSVIGIGCAAGSITLESSCTAGTISISGNGQCFDNTTQSCYVINTITDGTEIANLQRVIEYLRPNHTGSGNVWYWDPYGGDDTWDGSHPKRATKTFAQAHNLAANANHDIIMCVSGNPTGLTTSNENITITKDYLFLRGPGRDFSIVSTDDNLDTITIESRGVEVSGLRVATLPTSTKRAIYSTGHFALIQNIFIHNSHNGIEIAGGEYSAIRNTQLHHCGGYGIRVSGAPEHTDITDCNIGENGGNGIEIDIIGHEVNIVNTISHKNDGHGIYISNTSEGVIIKDTNYFLNLAGDLNDLGLSTKIITGVSSGDSNAPTPLENAVAVWNYDVETATIDPIFAPLFPQGT